MLPKIVSVNLSPTHTFSKYQTESIHLLKGLGVEGDAHCGVLMKHRSRLKIKPIPPNLRQVHLIHCELFSELQPKGYEVTPGLIGENITTAGIDLLGLPRHTKLRLGDSAIIEVTGLRNPCNQLDNLQPGLRKAVLDKDAEGNLIRKSGIMAIVLKGGIVNTGDLIEVELPKAPFIKLERV